VESFVERREFERSGDAVRLTLIKQGEQALGQFK
jgi:hypothetical protein